MNDKRGTDPVVCFYEEFPFPNNVARVPGRVRFLGRLLGKQSYRRLLSVGCGTGEELLALQTLFPGAVIEGLEPSLSSTLLAREKGFTVYHTTMEAFSPLESYDAIVCTGVLHHLRDPIAGLRLLRSWLGDHGVLYLGLYHHVKWDLGAPPSATMAEYLDAVEHPRQATYSWASVLRLLKQESFVLSRTGHRLPVPSPRLARYYDALFYLAQQEMIFIEVKK